MSLRSNLDKAVHDIVLSFLEANETASISLIYDHIQRSNSSLRRMKKQVLEGSIERVLDANREEDESTQGELSAQYQQESTASLVGTGTDGDANIMNKRIRDSMRRQNKGTPQSNGVSRTQDQQTTSTAQVRAKDNDNPRPSKRPKITDSAVVAPPTHVRLGDMGGIEHLRKQINELICVPLLKPRRYTKMGAKIPRGVLLHGPPGCGKTMLCEAIAGTVGVSWLPISAPSIVSGMSGESEKTLRQHFEAAVAAAPCIIFIDEIDAITPKREASQREMDKRIVAQLLTCMDDLAMEKTGGKVVIVLAATNRPDSLDPALRRGGRFENEISIGPPNEPAREAILKAMTKDFKLDSSVDFKELAKLTSGYVGADLLSLTSKAAAQPIARYTESIERRCSEKAAADGGQGEGGMELDGPLPYRLGPWDDMVSLMREDEDTEDTTEMITMLDFKAALPQVQPSAMREGFATIPNTRWEDVGVPEHVRKDLQRAIVDPILNPKRYRNFNAQFLAGVLLWGPPGCGKTLLAKAVANESRANFISVKGPELLNKYLGESERAVRQLFSRAASSAPCVIFLDEFDALVPRRDDTGSDAASRVVNAFLTEMDGVNERGDIYIIAATNRPEIIDAAMLRPGRLGKHIEIPLPDAAARVDILERLLRGTRLANTPTEWAEFARAVGVALERFSGADLSNLVSEAVQLAIERAMAADEGRDEEMTGRLELADLLQVAGRLTPSISARALEEYARFKLVVN